KGRRTVLDLLDPSLPRVFPVGRLDRATTGLLLLTNDTAFGEAMTSPASKLPKTYAVKVRGKAAPEHVRQLEQGVVLDDGHRTRPARARLVRTTPKGCWVELTITEGRNRQVRRMMA